MDYHLFGKKLEKIIIEKNETIASVADKTKVSKDRIERVIGYGGSLDFKEIEALQEYLNVDLSINPF